jgi:hypothetical protein
MFMQLALVLAQIIPLTIKFGSNPARINVQTPEQSPSRLLSPWKVLYQSPLQIYNRNVPPGDQKHWSRIFATPFNSQSCVSPHPCFIGLSPDTDIRYSVLLSRTIATLVIVGIV